MIFTNVTCYHVRYFIYCLYYMLCSLLFPSYMFINLLFYVSDYNFILYVIDVIYVINIMLLCIIHYKLMMACGDHFNFIFMRLEFIIGFDRAFIRIIRFVDIHAVFIYLFVC